MIYTYISFFHFVSFLKNFPQLFPAFLWRWWRRLGTTVVYLPKYGITQYFVPRPLCKLRTRLFYGIHEALILIKVKERSGKQIGLAERLEDTKAKTKWPFFLINSVLFWMLKRTQAFEALMWYSMLVLWIPNLNLTEGGLRVVTCRMGKPLRTLISEYW